MDIVVDESAEIMHENGESHLPSMEKKQRCKPFLLQFAKMYPGGTPLSYEYLLHTWKQRCTRVQDPVKI